MDLAVAVWVNQVAVLVELMLEMQAFTTERGQEMASGWHLGRVAPVALAVSIAA
jgi:hypothetical protein